MLIQISRKMRLPLTLSGKNLSIKRPYSLGPRIIAQFSILLLIVGTFTLSGCSNLGYYGQAVFGQAAMLLKRKPIEKVLQREELSDDKKNKLRLVLEIRKFARDELGWPVGGSYTTYVELGRPYVVWNLVVVPEFSLEPMEFCFLVAGCVTYKGFFNKEKAFKNAEKYLSREFDVSVGGVRAYSTLGWFDDPVLDTFLSGSEVDLAALLFHEFAHQVVYVPEDTIFNESFASAVEIESVRRWLLRRGTANEFKGYQEARHRQKQFVEFLEIKKEKLRLLYQSDIEDEEKRSEKKQLFAEIRRDFQPLKQSWGGAEDFSDWMGADLNNADLSTISTYHDLVPGFQRLLAKHQGKFAPFFDEVKAMKKMTSNNRQQRLRTKEESGRHRSL